MPQLLKVAFRSLLAIPPTPSNFRYLAPPPSSTSLLVSAQACTYSAGPGACPPSPLPHPRAHARDSPCLLLSTS
eukprot:6183468-Pleurochrysis_carterae.AAC.2